MSALMDLVQSAIKENSIGELSRQIGQDEQTTSNAIESALPILIGALNKSTTADNGEGLHRALEKKHDGSILDDVAGFIGKNDQSDGKGILGHILGQNRDSAAMFLGTQSGIGESNATSLMASLAPVVLGALGKAKSQRGLNGGELSDLLTNEAAGLQQRTPSMMKMVGKLIDQDGDGDADMMDAVSALMKRF